MVIVNVKVVDNFYIKIIGSVVGIFDIVVFVFSGLVVMGWGVVVGVVYIMVIGNDLYVNG